MRAVLPQCGKDTFVVRPETLFTDVGRGRPPEERGHVMTVNIGQETGCDNGMLLAVYKCLFGIERTVADD